MAEGASSISGADKVKYPNYQEYSSRLESFVAWPGMYVPKTPEELATAGFFYIGSADRVTCFHCGTTLRDWEEDHDPVTEHRRYSEGCQFIIKSDINQLGVSTRTPADSKTNIDQTEKMKETDDRFQTTDDDNVHKTESAPAIESALKESPCRDKKFTAWRLDKEIGQLREEDTALQNAPPGNLLPYPAQTSSTSAGKRSTDEGSTLENSLCAKKRLSCLDQGQKKKRLLEQGTCRACRESAQASLFQSSDHQIVSSHTSDVLYCVICKNIPSES